MMSIQGRPCVTWHVPWAWWPDSFNNPITSKLQPSARKPESASPPDMPELEMPGFHSPRVPARSWAFAGATPATQLREPNSDHISLGSASLTRGSKDKINMEILQTMASGITRPQNCPTAKIKDSRSILTVDSHRIPHVHYAPH